METGQGHIVTDILEEETPDKPPAPCGSKVVIHTNVIRGLIPVAACATGCQNNVSSRL